MKKILTFVFALVASATLAHAQLGVVAGINVSGTNLDTKDLWSNAKNVTLYHVGLVYKSDLGLGFAVQPSLTYEMKGANLSTAEKFSSVSSSLDTKSGFLELGVGIQWGPDLIIGRPYLFLQPFAGYQIVAKDNAKVDALSLLTISDDDYDKALSDAKNKLEYGFGFGAGVELIKHLQLSVQYFVNLGTLYNEGKVEGNEVWNKVRSTYQDIENYNGVKVTLGYFF